MEKEYCCSQINHLQEQIIGFCLNEECKENSQCCCLCFLEGHNSHKKDCKNMVQILNMIKQSGDVISSLSTQVNESLKEIQNIHLRCQKLLTQRKEQLVEFQNYIEKQQYYKITHMVESLKQWNLINEKSSRISNPNDLGLEILFVREFAEGLNKIGNNFQGSIDTLKFLIQEQDSDDNSSSQGSNYEQIIFQQKQIQANQKMIIQNNQERINNQEQIINNKKDIIANLEQTIQNKNDIIKNNKDIISNQEKTISNQNEIYKNSEIKVKNNAKILKNDEEIMANNRKMIENQQQIYENNRQLNGLKHQLNKNQSN